MAWTEYEIETLERMWNAGATAAAIEDRLGRSKSRSAIIGKASRLNLASRPNPVPRPAGALPSVMVRKLHMRLHQMGLPTGGREAIIEAFAFTQDGTAEQVARALGVPQAKVDAAVDWLEQRYGGEAA